MLPAEAAAVKATLDLAAGEIKRGEIAAGRSKLEWVLQRDPQNVLAWLWMTRCLSSREERIRCFHRVLAIDPANRHALNGLESLHAPVPQPTGSPIAPQQPASVTNVIVQAKKRPGCVVQALWFLFVGWWLGSILTTVAWLLNVTIIGLPLGMAILNNIPKILALQDPSTQLRATTSEGATILSEADRPQRNFLVRVLYFVIVGWWWSGIWLAIGYILCGTIILMPVGLHMFRLAPAMTTLRRY